MRVCMCVCVFWLCVRVFVLGMLSILTCGHCPSVAACCGTLRQLVHVRCAFQGFCVYFSGGGQRCAHLRRASRQSRTAAHAPPNGARAGAHHETFLFFCLGLPAMVAASCAIVAGRCMAAALQRTRHLPAPALPRRTRTLFAFAPAGRDGPVWRHCFFVIEMYAMPPTPPFSCPCCCSCCC